MKVDASTLVRLYDSFDQMFRGQGLNFGEYLEQQTIRRALEGLKRAKRRDYMRAYRARKRKA